MTLEDLQSLLDLCDQEYREELCPGGTERLAQIREEVAQLEMEKDSILERMYPEKRGISGEPYIRALIQHLGCSREEAVSRLMAVFLPSS
jgi:hypothetical protein